jgi:hypothetical protein
MFVFFVEIFKSETSFAIFAKVSLTMVSTAKLDRI